MPNQLGFFPYTPATNLLYGLREALHMLNEEGLPDVFRRHDRHGEATRAAVRAWGLEIVCEEPREYSSSMTAVFTPEGHSADRLREIILENFDMALGAGLGKLAGKAFRIGHLGSFNDLMLAGTLSGVETGLRLAGVPHNAGGVMAALDHLAPADTKSQSSPWPDEGRAIAGRGNVFTQVDSCGIPSGSANGKSTEIARSHVRWIVLLLLCLMYLITYLDRVSLSNTAPFISQEFGFSKATMGVIFSAFVWAYALFQVFGGWLGDRFGLRKVLTIIMAYRTVMAVLTTAAMGFSSFWAVRFMLGVGEAGAFPTATRAMQMWFPRKERGFVQGISHAASRFGAAVGPPPAVAIMIRYGWRIVFYVIGFISLVWSLLFSLIYRNTPEEHKQVSRSELALIRGVDENGGIKQANVQKRLTVPWKILLKHPNIWAVMCGYFTYLYCLWIFLSWLPSYLVSYRGFTLLKVGSYASLPIGAGMLGDAVGGWLTDFLLVKTGNVKFARRSVAIMGMLGCGSFILPAAFTANPYTAVYCLAAAMFFLETIIGPSWAVPMDIGGEYCVRNDEHGRTDRWGAVADGVWDPGGPRVLDRAVRDRCLPAIPRRWHLGVLDRSGSVRHRQR